MLGLLRYVGFIWGWIQKLLPFVSTVVTSALGVASSIGKSIAGQVFQWLGQYSALIFFLFGFSVFLELCTPVIAFALYHLNMTVILAFAPFITFKTAIIIFAFFYGLAYLALTIFFYRLLKH